MIKEKSLLLGCIFFILKKFLIWPQGSGAAGLQVVSGQVKIKKKFLKSSTYKTKYASFIFKYINSIQKDAYMFHNLTSNSFFFFVLTCPETTCRPAAPESGGEIQNFLNIRKMHLKTFFLNNLSSHSQDKDTVI